MKLGLKHFCPTLRHLPHVTTISNGKFTAYLSNSDKSGDSKASFVTIVTYVSTECCWTQIVLKDRSTMLLRCSKIRFFKI